MAPEQKRVLLELLGNQVISAVVIPTVLTVLVALWKGVARPGPFRGGEDLAWGMDLYFAAIGSELGALALLASQPPSSTLDADVDLGIALLGVIVFLGVLTTIMVRLWGYRDDGAGGRVLTSWVGLVIPNFLGILVLTSVYAVNSQLIGAS